MINKNYERNLNHNLHKYPISNMCRGCEFGEARVWKDRV